MKWWSIETGVVGEGVEEAGKRFKSAQVSAPKGGLSQPVVAHIPYTTDKFSQWM